jgi:dTDP-4-dehydrorhamnose 3,5-epimerase
MKIVEHKTFKDNRGSYTPFPLDVMDVEWDQCSISINDGRYTFRGLHYQTNPPQEKYVKVVKGSIIDIGYDLNTKQTKSVLIDEGNAVYLNDGYAHGFLTLEPDTIVVYLVKGEYSPVSEHSIVWSEVPEVKEIINRYTDKVIISEKDEKGK